MILDPLAGEKGRVVFKTIVWATGGSENADRALPVTKELAQRDGSTVIVAQTVPSS